MKVRMIASTLAALIASCAAPPIESPAYTIDGIPVCGHASEISRTELRAAIAFDRSTPSYPEYKIYSIDVVDRTELHIYHTTKNRTFQEYKLLKKVQGRWTC